MVLVGVHCHACALQQAAHTRIARQRLGLVVVVGEDRGRAQLLRQARNFLFGQALAHDQAGIGVAGERAQLGIDAGQAFTNELDAPVGARQRREDGVVEKKDAMHLRAAAQGMKKGGVVARAQVASQPDQAHRSRKCHGSPLKSRNAR